MNLSEANKDSGQKYELTEQTHTKNELYSTDFININVFTEPELLLHA